jgi:hypothetical protein
MTESFDADWLELREPHDARARSEPLAAQLIALLPARPRLLDLGAGTGSLFRWLAPQIGRAQAWTLVDADAALIEEAFDTIADRAEDIGLRLTFPAKRTMLVHAPGGAWRVEGLVADLAAAPANLPLINIDAVVNSALCDLVSTVWLERMAAALRVPFYAALCVDGREHFLPRHPADGATRQGFHKDQMREKGFGRALGPAAPAEIARVFTDRGFVVSSAASDWQIGPNDAAMLTELVTGHASAGARQNRAALPQIQDWLSARLDQASIGRLRARIGHRDVLAVPNRK